MNPDMGRKNHTVWNNVYFNRGHAIEKYLRPVRK